MRQTEFRWLMMLLMLLCRLELYSQDFTREIREAGRLEALAEKRDAEPEDDSYEQDLENWRRHPLDLNQASADDLSELPGLTALQIVNFIQYRKLLGSLVSVYELQAVPGWDPETIRELLPYIKTGQDGSLYSALQERWKGGERSFLLRTGQVLERSAGYERSAGSGTSPYLGSPQRIFFRYAYNYRQILQYGISGEKDAGEPFLQGAQRYGFDFYSFHFFLRNTGIVKDLALGDFTVNLGQGLIQWQTISFTKGSMVLGIKRQSSRLRPYHSAGEFNFHRGCGITLEKGNWSSTLFISSQKISSNPDWDTAGREDIFTSFENSGYHRTANEIADRNNNNQFSAGGSLGFSKSRLSMGINLVHFRFSSPFQKKDEPYNLYSFKGRTLSDASFDYACTAGNMHFFGELASDQRSHLALIQGILLGLNNNLDISLLYRNISAAYESLYTDAYTESRSPVNEKGFYTGFSFRPWGNLKIEMYYDLFSFQWLKYRVDAPSSGNDLFAQIFFQKDKNWYLSARYKKEVKAGNQNIAGTVTYPVFSPVKQQVQLETGYQINRNWRIKTRMENIWIRKNWVKSKTKPEGFLGILDVFYNSGILGGNIRVQRFLIPGYDFRIYISENDMLFNFSLPPYYDNGWRYYINLHKGFHLDNGQHTRNSKQITAWIKWGQSIYPDKHFIGSGLDRISGNRKTEIKAEILVRW